MIRGYDDVSRCRSNKCKSTHMNCEWEERERKREKLPHTSYLGPFEECWPPQVFEGGYIPKGELLIFTVVDPSLGSW